ncbi:hypothetical protein [Nocardia yamanashiensis]|uniref:hypothetical protein n=1 Tax=Nocardia yamanashiensis TaxID=209247 RepID=UPI0008351598|nr:hypothetical protein [Nocardia yamanashiensis]
MPQREKASRNSVIGRAAVASAVVAAGLLAGQGTASADFSAEVPMNCVGLSPNIVDVPYSGKVYLGQYNAGRPGWTSVTVHTGASIWGGYTTNPTITWTNLNTGVTGTASGSAPVSSMFGTGAQNNFDAWGIGGGPVRFDLTVVNSGLAPVPAVSCSGTIDVP